MNWRCGDCRQEFSEPIERSESVRSEAWGQVAWTKEVFNTCPHCGSESVDEFEEECPDCEGRGCVECGANVGAE